HLVAPWLLARTDPAIRVLSKTAHPVPGVGAFAPDLMAITGCAGQLPSHRHRRAWETGGCLSPRNQPPGSSREGKPDKLAWEPLNPRGGSGERIDQTVCAGDGQRRYWVLSARGDWRGDDPGPGRGGHADPAGHAGLHAEPGRRHQGRRPG